ncbi:MULTISPECIES: polysaccharide deacetylase family protein [Paenibacillus]|uniref:polysaccharide deacetylase family protein n=1 Tax=Paenibacillus TaxID=44249 RepID=UPI001F362957|nr:MULTISPECIES: polysaccharide deacetylase family protein [Paenibacillus]
MVKQTAVLLAAAFLLASCSSGNNAAVTPGSGTGASSSPQSTAAAASPGVASPSPAPSAAAAGQDALASPSPSASVQPSSGPEDTASASASSAPSNDTGEAVALQYHMNKNYDIKPNDDSVNKKIVLLTFDDGPKDAKMINSIFDTLDKHHAQAIFFVNGYRVKEHPELLKLIQQRGGIIGNHSWDHIVLKDKSYAEVKKQIEDVQKIVKEVTGETPVFFRPPHGAGGDVGKKVAAENGMLYMTWSNGSLDWTMSEKEAGKTGKIIKNVTDQLHSGSNILMHELPWTTEALDQLLTTLEGKGYGFVDPRSIELKAR